MKEKRSLTEPDEPFQGGDFSKTFILYFNRFAHWLCEGSTFYRFNSTYRHSHLSSQHPHLQRIVIRASYGNGKWKRGRLGLKPGETLGNEETSLWMIPRLELSRSQGRDDFQSFVTVVHHAMS